MESEPKQARPGDQAEGTDPDLPQDPGIPGSKTEEEQPEEAPAPPGRGFPDAGEQTDASDEPEEGPPAPGREPPSSGESEGEQRGMREAAEADDTLAPGSMPPEGSR